MPKPSPIKDHLGQTYPNEKTMCEAWGVALSTYRARCVRGWSKEAALTNMPTPTSKPRTDHEGRTYPSIKDMCEAWGVSTSVYNDRAKKGWSIEDSLTGKRPCKDHTGTEFPTETAMCEAWNIPRPTYIQRRKRGWSLEQALTGNHKRVGRGQPCKDHTGREFPSQVAMLAYWGITRAAFNSRLRSGWSLEEALTGNRKSPKDKNKEADDEDK